MASLIRLAALLSFAVLPTSGTEREMTVSVGPRSEECFYETLKTKQILEVSYQVIDGGQGELDISFHLTSPSNRVLIMDYKKPEQSHVHEVTEDGDYRICFNNRFSNFNSKTVFFEILIDANEDDDEWGNLDLPEAPDKEYEVAIQGIQEVVTRVKSHLYKIRHMQEKVRAFAARDTNLAEGNFFRVNSWSILQIVIMLLVGFIQVVMVKSLFDEQSKMHKLWKTRCS